MFKIGDFRHDTEFVFVFPRCKDTQQRCSHVISIFDKTVCEGFFFSLLIYNPAGFFPGKKNHELICHCTTKNGQTHCFPPLSTTNKSLDGCIHRAVDIYKTLQVNSKPSAGPDARTVDEMSLRVYWSNRRFKFLISAFYSKRAKPA